MTCVRRAGESSVLRNTELYNPKTGIITYHELGNANTPEKTAPRSQEFGLAALSCERVSKVVFSADAQEDCPSVVATLCVEPTSLAVGHQPAPRP